MSHATFVRLSLTIAVAAALVPGASAQTATDTTRRTAPNTELPLVPMRALELHEDPPGGGAS